MCFQSYYLQSGMYSPNCLQNFALGSEKISLLETITKLDLSHKHRKFHNFLHDEKVLFWEVFHQDKPILVSLKWIGQQLGESLNLHQINMTKKLLSVSSNPGGREGVSGSVYECKKPLSGKLLEHGSR